MPAILNINSLNKVDKSEAEYISNLFYYWIVLKDSDIQNKVIVQKTKIIAQFKKILEEILTSDHFNTKQEKVKIIKLIHKLNQQEAAAEYAAGNKQNLKIAAVRLGRKSQSGFGSSGTKKRLPNLK